MVGIHHAAMEERKLLSMPRWRRAPPPIPSARACRGLWQGTGPEPGHGGAEISGQGFWPRWTGSRWPRATTSSWRAWELRLCPCHQVGTVIHLAVDGALCRTYSDCGCDEAHRQGGDGSPARSRGGKDGHAHRGCPHGGPAGGGGAGVDQVFSELLPGTRWPRWRRCCSRSRQRSWPLWGMASTTPRFSPGRISALPWGPWGRTRPLRPPMWF